MMRKKIIAIISLVFIVLVFYVFDVYASDPCSGTGAIEQGQCAERKLNVADKKLNEIYKKLLTALPHDMPDNASISELKSAQRAWIDFRNKNCEFEGEILGGARIWKSTYSVYCIAEMTEARVRTLTQYYRCVTIGGNECNFTR